MHSYTTLIPYFKKYKLRLLIGLTALLLVDLFQLSIPRVIKYIVDDLTTFQATSDSLAWAGVIIVGLAAGIGLLRYIWRPLVFGFARILEEDLRNRLHHHLLRLSPSWFQGRPTGELMALGTNDIEAVRMAGGMGLVALLDALALGLTSIAFMIWINPMLTVIAMVTMPLIIILTKLLGGLIYSKFQKTQEHFGKMTELGREAFSGIKLIQAQGGEKETVERMNQAGKRYIKLNMDLAWVSGSMYPLMLTFTNLSVTIVIYFGGRLTIFNSISPGDFVAFISYLGLLTWPMMAMGWVVNIMQRGSASLERVNSILQADPDITSPINPEVLDNPKGKIEISGLNYLYPNTETSSIKDINLVFPAGKVTALVGRTASGKSTLLNLIPRLIDPLPGTVFIDDIDVTRLDLTFLRNLIGVVPQDNFIFTGTIADNISFGNPEADFGRIQGAAKAASFEKEIMLMAEGYQSPLGELGLTLSGGQRQRLSLARALLVDPTILLLDDPFSAVDAAVEETILKNLCEIRKDKTTIIVSHRLTSLKTADLIHVLDNGKVIESGTRVELLANNGYFAKMNSLQELQVKTVRSTEGIQPDVR